MEAHRTKIIWLALSLALAGCKDDSARLEAENARLAALVNEQAGTRAAELAYLETQASISAGCDWLVPLCPRSIVEPGRQAIAAGFGGGSDWPFWAAVLAKLAAAGAFAGSTIGVSMWAAHRFARPEAAAVERARALLETAEKSAQEAAKRAADAQKKWQEMEHLIDQQKTDLAALERQIEQQKRETAALEAAQKALRAFD